MTKSSIKTKYKVIVVGGGINGVGIARDLALRGVDCLLVEKGDFSAGTSGASSGMIHGGPRYMLGDVDVTKLACLDSGYIQKAAPHLLFRIPFLYTVYHSEHLSKFAAQIKLEAVESFFTAYDDFVPLKNGQPHTRLTPNDVAELEPNVPQKNLMGAVTFDEWGIDVPRLCVANAIDAVEHGATVLNHTEVVEVLKDQNQIKGVVVKDVLTGETHSVECDILINATGPWAPQFAKQMGVPIQLRGGKGIHITFDRRLFNMAIVSQTIDGREIFMMPYENVSVLGTTDDDYFDDLDDQKCSEDEIKYLLDAIRPVFPAVDQARMIRSWSGVRPTLYERGVMEDDLSREHEVVDHSAQGLSGAYSMLGGKLASYRIMAEELVDLVCQKLGVTEACKTQTQALPGGEEQLSVADLVKEYDVDAQTISRMLYRHGSRAKMILETIHKDRRKAALLCSCEPVTLAEVEYVIQNEMVRTLSDLRRRTRATLGPCQGGNCSLAMAAVMNQLYDKSPQESWDDLKRFEQEWWWNKACVLNSDQLAQEELNQALANL